MTETPLIVRVMRAEDWLAGFRILWTVTFGRLAAGGADMVKHVKWPERRRLCRAFAGQCIDECDDAELAAAWTVLSTDPADASDPQTSKPLCRTLATAIVVSPTLLDDTAFAEAVAGWRSIVNSADAGAEDLIAAARARGAVLMPEDKAETLKWARFWVEQGS